MIIFLYEKAFETLTAALDHDLPPTSIKEKYSSMKVPLKILNKSVVHEVGLILHLLISLKKGNPYFAKIL